MSIYKKISEFQSKVGAIKKDSKNPHYKSTYADINTVLDAIRTPLKEVGLTVVQLPQETGLLTYIVDVETNEKIESFVPFILGKQDMQGLGSAVTYSRRFAIVAMLGLEQEDDDGNATIKQANKPETVKDHKKEIMDLIVQTETDLEKFKAFLKVSNLDDAPYELAKSALMKKVNK
jgi:hypothetical protein